MTDELRVLQEKFQAYFLEKDDSVLATIVDKKTAPATQRLAVYGDAYYYRLIDILSDDYRGLYRYLGEGKFQQLARDYIDAYPSDTFSVRFFGRHFSQFLQNNPDYTDAEFLSEMALFEWRLGDVFDAVDEPILCLEDLAAVPQDNWPDMAFRLQSHIQQANFHWNVSAVWEALDKEKPHPALERDATATTWLIWRMDFRCHFIALSQCDAWALNALSAGENFAFLCDGLCEWMAEDDVAEYAGQLLLRWLKAKLFQALLLP